MTFGKKLKTIFNNVSVSVYLALKCIKFVKLHNSLKAQNLNDTLNDSEKLEPCITPAK